MTSNTTTFNTSDGQPLPSPRDTHHLKTCHQHGTAACTRAHTQTDRQTDRHNGVATSADLCGLAGISDATGPGLCWLPGGCQGAGRGVAEGWQGVCLGRRVGPWWLQEGIDRLRVNRHQGRVSGMCCPEHQQEASSGQWCLATHLHITL